MRERWLFRSSHSTAASNTGNLSTSPDHTIAAKLDTSQADAVQNQLVQGNRAVASAEYQRRRATAMTGRLLRFLATRGINEVL